MLEEEEEEVALEEEEVVALEKKEVMALEENEEDLFVFVSDNTCIFADNVCFVSILIILSLQLLLNYFFNCFVSFFFTLIPPLSFSSFLFSFLLFSSLPSLLLFLHLFFSLPLFLDFCFFFIFFITFTTVTQPHSFQTFSLSQLRS